ncbi:sugar phosphate isomerase/epimerase family protein [Sediminibacillus halophilus]|uniref:Sugar phosphate isomerase/epimerase n=1 Tax=Sediminibacillus halophilus TaxID=482461 RepID=A0A1G9N885_9BACI|nr:sugar phosphate isomerase/epimerase [Sediminibacillus halophilus]SDL82719.1 Sugar phosphate isomerase/epimerase [Sediminibacillus halophilus]
MSVGVLAHLMGKQPWDDLAEKVGKEGFAHVQLALWKAIDSPDFQRPGCLSPGLARSILSAFKRHGVSISVLACYLHLYERDPEKRQENLERFKELIRYAPLFDCYVVAAEVGKMPGGFIPEDWEVLKESLELLIEEAEKHGVLIGIEPANDHLIGDAKTLERMLEQLPSSNIGVVLDPVNLLTAENFSRQDEVIEQAFRRLGNRILACHAKDRIMENGQITTVPPGSGHLNYDLYFQLLHQYKPEVDVIMEAAKTPEQRQISKTFLDQKYNLEKKTGSRQ